MKTQETRKFKMHPDLLFSVIKSQAGTHEKALLEAVMNAVDAHATKCHIIITSDGYSIVDDGKGFSSQEEIEQFFETFGTPHKEGDATYGRFRMGRGQLFAFSKNTWLTNTFKMEVDIRSKGLDYSFKNGLSEIKGCQIKGTWNEPLDKIQLFNVVKELEKLIKYMQIPVYINKKLVSIQPENEKWTYSENDFYIRVDKSSKYLSVYNMGSLVNHYSSSKFGVGGVIVTKKALQVNFARNDILIHQCQLWKQISKKLNEILEKSVKSNVKLSEEECLAIINNIFNESVPIHQYFKIPVIFDINHKRVSIYQILQSKKISFANNALNLNKQKTIHDRKIALVLKSSILEQLNFSTGQEFIMAIYKLIDDNNKKLREVHNYTNYIGYYNKPDIVLIDELISEIKGIEKIKDVKKYNKKEKALMKALNIVHYQILHAINSTYTNKNLKTLNLRALNLGISDTALAWTDGANFITLNQNLVNADILKIIHVIIHEYCHNENSMEYHEHGLEFYELFHDIVIHNSKQIQEIFVLLAKHFNQSLFEEEAKPYVVLEKISNT